MPLDQANESDYYNWNNDGQMKDYENFQIFSSRYRSPDDTDSPSATQMS